MGTSLSRQNAAVEEADVTLNHPQYKYPPRTGKYFKCQLIDDWLFCVNCTGIVVCSLL